MKLKQLIEEAETLFSAEQQRKKNIKKVLKKLRKHQTCLSERLKHETNSKDTKKLEKKIALTKLHRKKGLAILKAKKAKKSG